MNKVIKTNKPMLSVIHDVGLDDGAWYEVTVLNIGIKGVRLVTVCTTALGEQPEEEMRGYDIHTYKYVVSRSTACLVSVRIP